MSTGTLKQALQSGRRVYGTLIVSPSPRWPDAVRRIGLDFVFIDTEHVQLDRAQVSWMCQVYRAAGLTPLVRIPSPDHYQACMALDAGAGGIIAPYIETVEQAQALRGAVKLRPVKGDRLAAVLQGSAALEPALQAYVDARNNESLFIINIESMPAIDRLDQLLAVPGLDAVLIGPHDLSCSLGIPERYDDPRFEAAVLRIIRQARAAGVAAGMHWSGPLERFGPWMDAGLNLIICSADITAMHAKLETDVASLRREAGDQPAQGGKAEAI